MNRKMMRVEKLLLLGMIAVGLAQAARSGPVLPDAAPADHAIR